jgi:hypothetical protein
MSIGIKEPVALLTKQKIKKYHLTQKKNYAMNEEFN